MENHAGIIRNHKSLNEGLEKIINLKEKSTQISLRDKSKVFNMELVNCLELKAMLDVAEALLRACLKRKETRGAHFRSDYPKRDDKNYLVNQLVLKSGERMLIKEAPVTITKWEPEERKY